MKKSFTLIELLVVLIILGVILSAGYTSCYKFISKKEYTGTVIACEKVVDNTVYTGKKSADKSLFSFSCDIKLENGEIISFSSEDRKFATVVKEDVIKVAVFKYAPWNFDKAGTLYGGRLIKKLKSAE